LKSLSLVTVLAACSAFAHASSITFDLVNVTSSAGTLTGTVDIDTVTELVTSANITFNDFAAGSPVFANIGSAVAHNGLGQDHISGLSNSPLNAGGQLDLYFDTSNLGLGNLSICFLGGPCGLNSSPGSAVQAFGPNGGRYYLTSGELDPTITSSDAAPTPEPPSLLLLGTGILGGAVLMARMSGRRANTPAEF
jgi:hypothetical protein